MAPVDMVVGNVLTAIGAAGHICLALAQVPLYLQMYREGSSDKYSPLPSLALSFVMSLWCGYTVWYLPLPAIYVANFSGMVIPFCYLMVHAALASTLKKKVADMEKAQATGERELAEINALLKRLGDELADGFRSADVRFHRRHPRWWRR